MEDVIFTAQHGGLMVVAFVPRPGGKDYEYRIQIGDYAPIDEFVPRSTFSLIEIPIVTRLLNMAYPVVFQHLRECT